ncbi:Allergen Asp f 15 [Coniochaeta hoffmannii]|uniref:Allergen Asp f 15 n=1 Tax=Coniochaeta hoffmannii TaxID=91930 RepID=A0AA38RU56_9PEZI|nr:Allergen Asp f 15 [Coniochaeta hoffmannii]
MSLPLLLWALLSAATRASAASGTIWATPHDSYSSSVGVLGCKIDTDRVAYWPDSIDCSNICVSVSYGGRQLHLLRIDQSGGAHDMSYDAWNYLYTGYSATSKPTAGGAVAMEYSDVDASECAGLIKTKGGRLPLSASNSMNFLASCLEQSGSWVAENYVLYNILDPICSYGYDETCNLDFPAQNQAQCPNPLGTPVALTTAPVYNIRYPTGEKVLAGSSGQQAGSTSVASRRGGQAGVWAAWVVPVVAWQVLRVYNS